MAKLAPSSSNSLLELPVKIFRGTGKLLVEQGIGAAVPLLLT